MASRLRRRIGTYFAAAGSVAGTTGGGAVGSTVSTTNWLTSAGLLWSSGVEPSGSESSLYPVQSGNRVWYVDANASSNGNGSSGSPYWSFTELNAGTAPGYAAGDHIYITGDFTQAKHSVGTREMGLTWTNSAYIGSTSNPTVIRSWPGQSRAKIDGGYNTSTPFCIQVTPVGAANTKGLVVINVEATRCVPAGLWLYTGGEGALGLLKVISCWLHHNYVPSSGPNSAYGGVVFQVRENNCAAEVRNCLIHDNRSPDGSTLVTNNNSGGIDFHTGPGDTGSTISIHDNVIFNEYRATGNKWSGTTQVEWYQNHIYSCTMAHFVRNARDNYIHHELVRNCTYFIYIDNENRATQGGMLRTLRYQFNTIDGTTSEVYFNANGDTTSYSDVTTAHHNIFSNSGLSAAQLSLGPYGSSGFYTAGIQYYDNCVYTANSAAMALLNGTSYSRSGFETFVGGTSVYSNPLYTNTASIDYTLQAGSPAASISGQSAGAF